MLRVEIRAALTEAVQATGAAWRPQSYQSYQSMFKAIIVIILICASGIAQDLGNAKDSGKLKIYSDFRACVETLLPEWENDDALWYKLRDSLIHDPPEFSRSLDREEMLKRLIELHEKRL